MTSNLQILLEMQLVNVLTHKSTGSLDQTSEYFISSILCNHSVVVPLLVKII